MSRHATEAEARSNAQANADAAGVPYVLFSDTSGGWNSERQTVAHTTSWSGVVYTVIKPRATVKKGVKLRIGHDYLRLTVAYGCPLRKGMNLNLGRRGESVTASEPVTTEMAKAALDKFSAFMRSGSETNAAKMKRLEEIGSAANTYDEFVNAIPVGMPQDRVSTR